MSAGNNRDTNLYPTFTECIKICNNVTYPKPKKLLTSQFEGDHRLMTHRSVSFYAHYSVNVLLCSNHHKNHPQTPPPRPKPQFLPGHVSLDLIMIIPYLQTISSLSPHNYANPLKMPNTWPKK